VSLGRGRVSAHRRGCSVRVRARAPVWVRGAGVGPGVRVRVRGAGPDKYARLGRVKERYDSGNLSR